MSTISSNQRIYGTVSHPSLQIVIVRGVVSLGFGSFVLGLHAFASLLYHLCFLWLCVGTDRLRR